MDQNCEKVTIYNVTQRFISTFDSMTRSSNIMNVNHKEAHKLSKTTEVCAKNIEIMRKQFMDIGRK